LNLLIGLTCYQLPNTVEVDSSKAFAVFVATSVSSEGRFCARTSLKMSRQQTAGSFILTNKIWRRFDSDLADDPDWHMYSISSWACQLPGSLHGARRRRARPSAGRESSGRYSSHGRGLV